MGSIQLEKSFGIQVQTIKVGKLFVEGLDVGMRDLDMDRMDVVIYN